LLKSLTGSDRQSERLLWGNLDEWKTEFKLFLMSNFKPVIGDSSEGFWSRIRLLPFTVRIPDADRIQDYHDVMYEAEGPGILRWAVEGCLTWQREELGYPTDVAEATKEYRAEQDMIGEFVGSSCERGVGHTVTMMELFDRYRDWSTAVRDYDPLNKKAFNTRLETQFELKKIRDKGQWIWQGIRLSSEAESESGAAGQGFEQPIPGGDF